MVCCRDDDDDHDGGDDHHHDDDDGDEHDDDEPSMLLWERRAGGRGMPRRLRPKYQQPMNLRPHILPLVWQAWDLGADGAVFVASIVTQT